MPFDPMADASFRQPLAMPQAQAPATELPKMKRGGMFGSRVKFGDFLTNFLINTGASNGNPAAQAFLQNRMLGQRQQQDREYEEQQYQRKRGDTVEDWIKKAQIEAQYGKPAAPHYWEDNTGNLMMVGPDGQPKQVFEDPNPYKLIPNGMGGVVPVNMRALMGGQHQPEILQSLPPGAKPIGGPGQQAPGTFPGY